MTLPAPGAAVPVGIEDIGFATAGAVLSLTDLAEANGVDPAKYHLGIGQDEMSIALPDEDIVTMGAEAARPLLDGRDLSRIRTLLFATESGIDQSKSAGVFVHALLGLDPACRVVELKQACYGATSAVQMATAIVARNPEQQVLVLAADIARYDVGSSGEPTQGAGAVALLIGANPAILEIEPISGLYTEDVFDFWRPNYRETALVNGALSIGAYLTSVSRAWEDYRAQGGRDFDAFDYFCYHQPFTKMAVKAHQHLVKITGPHPPEHRGQAQIASTFAYNRRIGNSYTASIYVALLALLEGESGDAGEDLAGRRIGFLSYGSGSVAEFFGGVVAGGYRQRLRPELTRAALERRVRIDHARYLELVAPAESWGEDRELPEQTAGPFRLAAVRGHRRIYERSGAVATV